LFAVRRQIEAGTLVAVLTPFIRSQGQFRLVWPSNHCLNPKVRAFVDFMATELAAP
jgi:DNA-binding transcriptional LysR family regulator